MLQSCQLSVLQMQQCLQMLQYCRGLKRLQGRKNCVCKCYRAYRGCRAFYVAELYGGREEKIVFANATEPTGVVELSMLRSCMVAFKIVAGVTEFLNRCESEAFNTR